MRISNKSLSMIDEEIPPGYIFLTPKNKIIKTDLSWDPQSKAWYLVSNKCVGKQAEELLCVIRKAAHLALVD